MGNRGVITFMDSDKEVGSIYLHWNGGQESVKAFLDYAKEVQVREGDPTYALARVVQIISNFLEGTLSVGVGMSAFLDCDNMDNGQYIVRGLDIVERRHAPADEFTQNYYEYILEGVRQRNKTHFYEEDGSLIR